MELEGEPTVQGRRCCLSASRQTIAPARGAGRTRTVQSAGKIVIKDDLMGRAWGIIVEENTIQVHISAIRKVLGTDRGMLKTISGRGYRLLGSWTIREEEASAEPIRFEQVRKFESLRAQL